MSQQFQIKKPKNVLFQNAEKKLHGMIKKSVEEEHNCWLGFYTSQLLYLADSKLRLLLLFVPWHSSLFVLHLLGFRSNLIYSCTSWPNNAHTDVLFQPSMVTMMSFIKLTLKINCYSINKDHILNRHLCCSFETK